MSFAHFFILMTVISTRGRICPIPSVVCTTGFERNEVADTIHLDTDVRVAALPRVCRTYVVLTTLTETNPI